MPTRISTLLILPITTALLSCGCDGARDKDAGGLDARPPRMCEATGASGPGGFCGCDGDCATGPCVPEDVLGEPRGVCIVSCDPATPMTCPAGSECFEYGSGMGRCAQPCTSHEDCGPSRACDRGVCFAFCGADSECESGHCDPYTHLCTDGTPSSGDPIGAECVLNDSCRSNACERGACIVVCRTSADCSDDTVCDARPGTVGRCRVGGCLAAGSASYYEPCLCDTDCPSGGVCSLEEANGFPMGACLVLCDPTSVSLCAPSVDCFRGSSGDGICIVTCASQSDCGPGRACFTGYCIAACFNDSDCRSGHCDPYSKRCTDGTPTSGSGIGAACASRAECRTNLCGGGQCTTVCRTTADCPEGTCVGATAAEVGSCEL